MAGSPHVTNRNSLIANLQALEAASIIGLIRRTWALKHTQLSRANSNNRAYCLIATP